jgi:hypothetical protein
MAQRLITRRSVFDKEQWDKEYLESRRVAKIIGRQPDPARIKHLLEGVTTERRSSVIKLPSPKRDLVEPPKAHRNMQISNTTKTSPVRHRS